MENKVLQKYHKALNVDVDDRFECMFEGKVEVAAEGKDAAGGDNDDHDNESDEKLQLIETMKVKNLLNDLVILPKDYDAVEFRMLGLDEQTTMNHGNIPSKIIVHLEGVSKKPSKTWSSVRSMSTTEELAATVVDLWTLQFGFINNHIIRLTLT